MSLSLSAIVLVSLILFLTLAAFAQGESSVITLVHSSFLDLLQAEELDTVLLDQAVHFTTPEATDIVAHKGTYRVVENGLDKLKLTSEKEKKALLVSALATTHQEEIATPIALYVRDDEKFPHIVLLLPDGNGLEAVGSYDVTRSRGLRSFQLTPSQIQEALKKKLDRVKPLER